MDTQENTKIDIRKTDEWNPNPSGKGGFAENPQNRNPGGWKSEDSISHQYKKLIRMTYKEVQKWLEEREEKGLTLAEEIAYNNVLKARDILDYTKEVTDRTEGKAPQTIVHEGGLFSQNKLEIVEVQPTLNEKDIVNVDESTQVV